MQQILDSTVNMIEIEKVDNDASDRNREQKHIVTSESLVSEPKKPVVSIYNMEDITEEIFKVTLKIIEFENYQVIYYYLKINL